MKISKLRRAIGIALLCVGFLCPSMGAQQIKKVPLSMGYSGMGIGEVDRRDAYAALKVWAEEIADKYGFRMDMALYESAEQLVKDFTDKKVDFATMHITDYLRFAPVLKVKAELARLRNNKISIKYLLVVNTADYTKGLANLRNKRLALKKDNDLGRLFLDVELMKRRYPPSDRYFSVIQETAKENQAALAVFFGRADACMISNAGFETMVELNPQVGHKLKVLASSPELVEVIGFFRKDYNPEYKKKALEGIIKGARTSKRASQMMLLFNTDSMDTITDDQLDTVRTLFAENNRLKSLK